jgi:hypothetical protein
MKHAITQLILLTPLAIVLCVVPGMMPVWAESDSNEEMEPAEESNDEAPDPPPIVVEGSPTMVYLTEPAIYVAIGIPYHLYFYHGRYYYHHLGYWYWAPGFHGPWVHMRFKALPPGFRKFKLNQLHTFRDREFRLYKTQGPTYKGRIFVAGSVPKDKPPLKKRPKMRGKLKQR